MYAVTLDLTYNLYQNRSRDIHNKLNFIKMIIYDFVKICSSNLT